MNWIKTFAILFASILLSLQVQANTGCIVEPGLNTKDSLKVEPKLKFNPLMLFSLPKAIEPIEQKSTNKTEDEDLGAI